MAQADQLAAGQHVILHRVADSASALAVVEQLAESGGGISFVDERVVELKGFGLDSGLTARLANRGAAWLMDQVTQSIALGAPGATGNARPCRA